jgi:hypothetical protein
MSWLHRQRVAVTALMFCAIAMAGVHLWLDVRPVTERESLTIVHAADDAVEIAGQELTLESAILDEYSAPQGTRSVSIRLHASGGADATLCGPLSLSDADGARTWLDADDILDVPYDEGESSCLEESAPYDILAVFLVPDDATGPFFFDVPGEDDVVGRFLIEP